MIAISLLVTNSGLAATKSELPAQLNVSFVQHNAVIHVYQPMIARVYEKLGIEVHFNKVDIERSLSLLNNGELDADVIRAGVVVEQNPNIIAVEPALTKMEVVLYCQYTLVCNKQAMQSAKHILGLVGSVQQHHQFLHDAAVDIVSFVDYQRMKRMFELGRIDYMININDLGTPHNHRINTSYKSTKLYQLNGYHLINKKWAHLLPQLKQAIIETQQEMHANKLFLLEQPSTKTGLDNDGKVQSAI